MGTTATGAPARPDGGPVTGIGTQPAARVRQATALLRSVLVAAPPDATSGPDAAALTEAFALAERVAGAGAALYARRVAATEAHRASGDRDAAGFLARVSGDPVGRARGVLETVARVADVPAVEAAFAAGRLSGAQAAVVAGAAAEDPGAADELLGVAAGGSFAELRAAAAAVRRRARGEEAERAREARAHARRYCRVTTPDSGGVRVDALLSKADGARLVARLEAETDAVFREARDAGEHEPHERYRADALVRLVTRSRAAAGGGPGAHVVVRVDAETLRSGAVGPGGTCEIAGVGQVPVDTARRLLGDCLFNVVVTDGVDVRTVTGTGRTVPHALRVALAERDPICVVPGCPVADHLEIDHWRVDFARGGPTTLDNLARLCGRHHAMKTTLGFRLAGGPGKWRWLRPK